MKTREGRGLPETDGDEKAYGREGVEARSQAIGPQILSGLCSTTRYSHEVCR